MPVVIISAFFDVRLK